MPPDRNTGDTPDEKTRVTAESTRLRVGPDTRALPTEQSGRFGSDTLFTSGKSIRLNVRGSRNSLAVHLALPIVAAVLLSAIIIALVFHNRLRDLQLQDLRNDAAGTTYTVSLWGRLLFNARNRFLAEYPEYSRRPEWRAGNHWLVTEGFIREKDWTAATGFQPDEYAPVPVLESATRKTVLSEIDKLVNSPDAQSEIIAILLVDADGAPFASSVRNGYAAVDAAVRGRPAPSAPPVTIGGVGIAVEYLPDAEPEPMVRSVAIIHSDDGRDRRLGSAVVLLRTAHHTDRLSAMMLFLAGLAAALVLLMAVVCWYSARRVTEPMRRLAADMQAIAEGDLSRRAEMRKNDELGLLVQAFNAMAERLRIARMSEHQTTRLETDLSLARDIQNNLLPPRTPHIRGLDLDTVYRPAREIGGDYFDFLPVDTGHLGLVIADASGKSIPAALVMATTRAIIRFAAPGGLSAAETLIKVNSILSTDMPRGMFVTGYYLIYNPREMSFLCASAGHTPLLVARNDDTVEIVNPGGIALGFDGGTIFQHSIREQRVRLEPGDRVLLYTDGVVECVNTASEEYSDRRLREFLRRNRTLSSHDFIGALMADLDRHRGSADIHDDTTVVTFRVL